MSQQLCLQIQIYSFNLTQVLCTLLNAVFVSTAYTDWDYVSCQLVADIWICFRRLDGSCLIACLIYYTQYIDNKALVRLFYIKFNAKFSLFKKPFFSLLVSEVCLKQKPNPCEEMLI